MTKRHIIILSIIVLAVFLFWSSIKLQNYFYGIVFSIEVFFSANPFLGAIIFLILGIFSATFSLFSSAPLVPIGIMAWGDFLTIVLLIAGWMLGSIFAYYIGWYAVHPAVKGFVPFEKIEFYRKHLSKKLELEIILIFRMAMPAEIASYVLGSLKYDFGKYILATFITELPFAVMIVYLGDTFLKNQFLIFLILLIAMFAIMGFMFLLLRKRLKIDYIDYHE